MATAMVKKRSSTLSPSKTPIKRRAEIVNVDLVVEVFMSLNSYYYCFCLYFDCFV